MKILLCTTVFQNQVAGPAVFIQALYTYFQKNTIEGSPLFQIATEDLPYETTDILEVPVNIPWPLTKIGMLSRSWFYYRRINQIRKFYPFTHLVLSDPIPGSLSIIKFHKKVKVICFVNDDDNIFPLQQKTLTKKLARLLYAVVQKRCLPKADLIITNSRYLTQLLGRRSNFPPIAMLLKGVDLKLFSFSAPLPIDLNKPIHILFIKKDYVRGGLFILLEALREIRHLRFSLTIIGPSEAQFQSIGPAHIADNLRLNHLEQCDREAVVTQMKAHQLFCVPSLREALGVANLEALACGLPVISTTAGGIPEATDNGRVAWLCPPNDAAALRDEILKCLNDSVTREEKVRMGRKWVQHNFALSQKCKSFFQMLQEIG